MALEKAGAALEPTSLSVSNHTARSVYYGHVSQTGPPTAPPGTNGRPLAPTTGVGGFVADATEIICPFHGGVSTLIRWRPLSVAVVEGCSVTGLRDRNLASVCQESSLQVNRFVRAPTGRMGHGRFYDAGRGQEVP
jgi:hypothetical protein